MSKAAAKRKAEPQEDEGSFKASKTFSLDTRVILRMQREARKKGLSASGYVEDVLRRELGMIA